MNTLERTLLAMVMACGLLVASADAQSGGKVEPQAPAEAEQKPPNEVPVRVTVVFSEFENERKVSSAPHVLSFLLRSDMNDVASLRAGVQVPVYAVAGAQTFSYREVGTNIDVRGRRDFRENRFILRLVVERSWVEAPAAGKSPEPPTGFAAAPVIRQFRWQNEVLMRDGETVQSIASTDPVSGRVIRVDVTLSVMK